MRVVTIWDKDLRVGEVEGGGKGNTSPLDFRHTKYNSLCIRVHICHIGLPDSYPSPFHPSTLDGKRTIMYHGVFTRSP